MFTRSEGFRDQKPSLYTLFLVFEAHLQGRLSLAVIPPRSFLSFRCFSVVVSGAGG